MKKYLYTLYLLPALLVAFASITALAEDVVIEDGSEPDAQINYVTLAWDRNSEPDIAGYNVYYGRSSGEYKLLKTVTDPTALVGLRGSKTVYFAVTAYNTGGGESEFSEEAHWP